MTRLWRIGAVSALGVLLAAGAWQMRRLQAATRLPVAPARKGDFLVIVRCRGELRARSSHQVVAPNVPQLRLVWQAPSGGPVKAGDPIPVEY